MKIKTRPLTEEELRLVHKKTIESRDEYIKLGRINSEEFKKVCEQERLLLERIKKL